MLSLSRIEAQTHSWTRAGSRSRQAVGPNVVSSRNASKCVVHIVCPVRHQKPSVSNSSIHVWAERGILGDLETVHLHGFRRDGETSLLVGQEGADIVALISLELNDIADFLVVHHGTIAGKLLLDDLEDLLEVEFGGDAGYGRQGLTTITLLDTDLVVEISLCFVAGRRRSKAQGDTNAACPENMNYSSEPRKERICVLIAP